MSIFICHICRCRIIDVIESAKKLYKSLSSDGKKTAKNAGTGKQQKKTTATKSTKGKKTSTGGKKPATAKKVTKGSKTTTSKTSKTKNTGRGRKS